MTGAEVLITIVKLLRALVQVGVPLVGLYVALKAPSRLTNPMWRSLTLFFGLTLAAAVGHQLMSLIGSPLLVQYLHKADLPMTQIGWILGVSQLPFTVISLGAWIVLVMLVLREIPRKQPE